MSLNLTLLSLSLSTMSLPFITTPNYLSSICGGTYLHISQLHCSNFFTPFYHSSARTNVLFQNSQFSHFLSTPLVFIQNPQCLESDSCANQQFSEIIKVTRSLDIYYCNFSNCRSNDGDGGMITMINNVNSVLNITGCRFKNCWHKSGPGVFYSKNSSSFISMQGCSINNCSSDSTVQLIQFMHDGNNELDHVKIADTSINFNPDKSHIESYLISSQTPWVSFSNITCTMMEKIPLKSLRFMELKKIVNATLSSITLENFYSRYLFFIQNIDYFTANISLNFSYIEIRNFTQISDGDSSIFQFDTSYPTDFDLKNFTYPNVSVDTPGLNFSMYYDSKHGTCNLSIIPDNNYEEIINQKLRPTASFSYSESFSSSSIFSKSNFFSSSSDFSDSSSFSTSSHFSTSFDFSESTLFSSSNDFTTSQFFSVSDDFTLSADFSKSSTFTSSQSFSKSESFTFSICFSQSTSFSSSQSFSKSESFTISDGFSKSSDFSSSQNWFPSKTFSGSSTFSKSSSFSSSQSFSISNSFTSSHSFSDSSSFSSSVSFTKSFSFSPSTQLSDEPNKNENESNNHMMLIIIISVVVFIIIVVIVVIFILYRKRHHQSESQSDEMDTYAMENETATVEVDENLKANIEDDPFKDELNNAFESGAVVI